MKIAPGNARGMYLPVTWAPRRGAMTNLPPGAPSMARFLRYGWETTNLEMLF
jgi:hypothetical protein